jgi:hemerythrin
MTPDELQDLKIGVPEIDGQHREFLRNLAALREAVTQGTGGRERMMRTLRYLEEYISIHFGTEERYMRLHNYPGILLHQKEHAEFSRRFEELKQTVHDREGRGEINSFVAVDVARRLERWLTDHILLTDRKLGDFLADRM